MTRKNQTRPAGRLPLLGLLLTLAAPAAVQAAPFCVQTMAVPPQCMYVDANSCRQRAAQMGGECTVNPAETRIVSAGLGQYCTVTSDGASSCVYPDLGSCSAAAARLGAACIRAPAKLAPFAAPDPYQQIRP